MQNESKDAILDEPDHRPTYVLTIDLAEKVVGFYGRGILFGKEYLPEPNDPFFEEVSRGLVSRLQLCYPQARILAIKTKTLAQQILAKAREAGPYGFLVSTCYEIAVDEKEDKVDSYDLEINRLFDLQGNFLGNEARPGFLSFDEQINEIAERAAGRKVTIMEDGSFTGTTISDVIDRLNKRGVEIELIVLGFAFPDAVRQIRKSYDGKIEFMKPIDNYIDWMPDHDFFPFIPNCGRVIGEIREGKLTAKRHRTDNAYYAVPYIEPFCPFMDLWAKIPKEHARDFSRFCLQKTLDLYEAINRREHNRAGIGYGRLLGSTPHRVHLPITIGAADLPDIGLEVISFLRQKLAELG